MIKSNGELKFCPFRVHGETRLSATVKGESYYNEFFMPCLKDECICYQKYEDREFCYREHMAFERNLKT